MTYSIQVLTVIFLSYPNKLHLNKIRYIECLRDLYRVIVIIKKKKKKRYNIGRGDRAIVAFGVWKPHIIVFGVWVPHIKKMCHIVKQCEFEVIEDQNILCVGIKM